MSLPEKIVVGGCARNCGPFLDEVFQNIWRLTTLFTQVYVIIAYDKSNDDTLAKLHSIQERHPGVLTILTNLGPLTPHRTYNIARARNHILQYIYDYYPDLHYHIMMDMDDRAIRMINLDSIRHAFAKQDQWDVLSFRMYPYYDLWALAIRPYLYSCWHWPKASKEVLPVISKYITQRLDACGPDDLLPCHSAFNAFAIYRTSMTRGCSYDGRTRLDLFGPGDIEEMATLLGKPPDKNPIRQDCEHRSFHFQMIACHQARVMISHSEVFQINDGCDSDSGSDRGW
jgi:hypothetical protein